MGLWPKGDRLGIKPIPTRTFQSNNEKKIAILERHAARVPGEIQEKQPAIFFQTAQEPFHNGLLTGCQLVNGIHRSDGLVNPFNISCQNPLLGLLSAMQLMQRHAHGDEVKAAQMEGVIHDIILGDLAISIGNTVILNRAFLREVIRMESTWADLAVFVAIERKEHVVADKLESLIRQELLESLLEHVQRGSAIGFGC